MRGEICRCFALIVAHLYVVITPWHECWIDAHRNMEQTTSHFFVLSAAFI
jgi:hypothetical protein